MSLLASLGGWALLLALGGSPAARGPQDAGADVALASVVRQVLIEKCGECHAPDGESAKARRYIHDVHDLGRVVDDAVVAGSLAASDLWISIDEDQSMPPDDAQNGPLTYVEKELLRVWILSGAPHPASGEGATATAPEERPSARVIAGRMHPLFLHFPIALLLAALAFELLSGGRPGTAGRVALLPLLVLAACTAPLTAFSGWLYAGEASPGSTLETHRWLGVAVAIASVVLPWLALRAERGGRMLLRLALLVTAVLVGLTAHLGGELVYGEDFLPF